MFAVVHDDDHGPSGQVAHDELDRRPGRLTTGDGRWARPKRDGRRDVHVEQLQRADFWPRYPSEDQDVTEPDLAFTARAWYVPRAARLVGQTVHPLSSPSWQIGKVALTRLSLSIRALSSIGGSWTSPTLSMI